MGQMQYLCSDDSHVECSDCDWTGTGAELDMITDFEERVSAGEVAPAGQCPKCGALAHLVEDNPPPVEAPELLDMLKRLLFVLDSPAFPRSLTNGGGALDAARALIARAEGTTP